MKFVIYTNSVSAHQLPFARELVKRVGADNFRYVSTQHTQGGAQDVDVAEKWIIRTDGSEETSALLEEADILLVGGLRPVDLIKRRLAEHKITLYMSERWFKPIPIFAERIWLPGWLKLLHPRYLRMAMAFANFAHSSDYHFLPIGPHSARDMEMMVRLFCPFDTSTLNRFRAAMIPWGYFVDDSKYGNVLEQGEETTDLRVLYIGRLLKLKRVDTIIRAVAVANRKLQIVNESLQRICLDIYGNGAEEEALMELAKKQQEELFSPCITFYPTVPLSEVRAVMRAHDVLVFASNSFDGWGAVVSEALSEGVPVIGTYETGASAALLPKDLLFHSGDVQSLSEKLLGFVLKQVKSNVALPEAFTPRGACNRLLNTIGL